MYLANTQHIETVKAEIAKLHCGVFFVHSDILKGFPVKLAKFSTEGLLKAHLELLQEITMGAQLFFPAFNLEFPRSQVHNVTETPSEMGHLSEYFRKHAAQWRDDIPMHSCCGTGPIPYIQNTMPRNPWQAPCVWDYLIDTDGYLLFYGAGLDAVSFLHYAENEAKVPYRYEKVFHGTLVEHNGKTSPIAVSHIVRPMQLDIDYDWEKLKTDLIKSGIWLDLSEKRTRILLLPVAKLHAFWKEKLRIDPLYFLNPESRQRAEELLSQIGHPFKLSDFE